MPTIDNKASTSVMINENYSNSDTITISDKSTKNKPFGWDTTTLFKNHQAPRDSTTPIETKVVKA